MCIEVYPTDGTPIRICYENESIRFLSPTSFVATYTLLIRNATIPLPQEASAITELALLYPRPIWKLIDLDGKQRLALQIKDKTAQLKTLCENGQARIITNEFGNEFELFVPNPQSPHQNLPDLSGRLGESMVLSTPPGFKKKHLKLLRRHQGGLAACFVRLGEPLNPGKAVWVSWEIRVDKAGKELPQSAIGKQVFHSFASPKHVRRTFDDVFQAGVADSAEFNQHREEDFLFFLNTFGLRRPRSVKTGYYEVRIELPDSNAATVLDWYVEGDLKIRSQSPEVQQVGKKHGTIYEWKSGQRVNGEDSDSPDFNLRLIFACPTSQDEGPTPTNKTEKYLFSAGSATLEHVAELDAKSVTEWLISAFKAANTTLSSSDSISIVALGKEWQITHDQHTYVARNERGTLNIYTEKPAQK
ncbi:MAG: hypothetical protein R3E01_32910 [Pirellulaceae bacterium]